MKLENFNFLGITIDKHTTRKHHVNKLSNKTNRTIGMLNRLKYFTNKYKAINLQLIDTFTTSFRYSKTEFKHGIPHLRVYSASFKILAMIASVNENVEYNPNTHSVLLTQMQAKHR